MNLPPLDCLEAFDIPLSTEIERLDGGQGTTYRAGDTILKPAFGVEEAAWVADVYNSIEQVGFRVPAPISVDSGCWVFEGWTAWEYLEGRTLESEKYQERLAASQAFHQALAKVPRPTFFDKRNDAWSQADRIVWCNAAWQPHARVQNLYEKLTSYRTHLDLPEQVMHGDITGNMLYQRGQPLAIIDFSPYWRPAAYAEALMCVDSLMWEQAPWSILELVELDETFIQLMLRAVMRRLVEVDRHFNLNHLPERYLDQVKHYERFASHFVIHAIK